MQLWNQAYSVYVPKMDSEHKRLLILLQRVSRALGKKYSMDATLEVLNEAMEYVNSHLKSEEEMLEHYHYPKLEEHKIEHAAFISEIQRLYTNYNAGDPITTIATINFLSEWFIIHIQGTDKEYGVYFQERGIVPEMVGCS